MSPAEIEAEAILQKHTLYKACWVRFLGWEFLGTIVGFQSPCLIIKPLRWSDWMKPYQTMSAPEGCLLVHESFVELRE